MKQVHVFYSGQVQGVGFRYTTVRISHRFAVTGWIRNLYDGRVEMLAEGQEDTLTAFLNEVRHGPLQQHIRDVQMTWADATHQYTEFKTVPTAEAALR